MKDFRYWLAARLCRTACWLRGEKWYVGDSWAGMPGNRASDLQQSIWERCVALEAVSGNKDPEWLNLIDSELTELGQAAGESWGHIWPKKP